MLQKQPIDISFAQGLDTKTDPWRVQAGKFLLLENAVFGSNGRLTKRNGFPQLAALAAPATTLSSFQDALVALGPTLQAFTGNDWVSQGKLSPATLAVQPYIRSAANQTQCDSATNRGRTCIVYTESASGVLSFKYAVYQGTTQIVPPTALPSAHTTLGTPRVWALGTYFVIVYAGSTSHHLLYIAISAVSSVATAPADLATDYAATFTPAFDGVVSSDALSLIYNSSVGGTVKIVQISRTLIISSAVSYAGQTGDQFMACASPNGQYLGFAWVPASGTDVYAVVTNAGLGAVIAPTLISSQTLLTTITGWMSADTLTLYYTQGNTYGGIVYQNTMTVPAASVGTEAVFARGVHLASKTFVNDGVSYTLAQFPTANQPSYFLLDGDGAVAGRLAYQNGYRTYISCLPNSVGGSIAYLRTDLVQGVNKSIANSANGVYTQTGINVAQWNFGRAYTTAEVGNGLHISGGLLQLYDGSSVTEHGFNVYPETYTAVTATTTGSMAHQVYYYQVIYSWTDAQGNVHRSAPGIPLLVDLSGSGTNTNKVTLTIPTLRLTQKANVKIQVYRWSTAQQNFFEATSITSPLLNNPAADTVTFVDTQADASILGNELIYTTGGVIENIPAPATNLLTVWDSRLWLVDAEDPNLLWYSKPVQEAVPVETSDVFTTYVAPTLGSAVSGGPVTAIAPLDDKLIAFKADEEVYIAGTGPDLTGAQNQYTEPTAIVSDVGCANQQSIVRIPTGLMFQSNKGIWLLDRGLGTSYIGADVEQYNDNMITAAQPIPGTNQVRFGAGTGAMLMYDYYYGQWGTFTLPTASSVVVGEKHTLLDTYGRVLQEAPGTYVDGSAPVEMAFTTAWLKLAGLQGYQRAYFVYLLGQLFSQHTLAIGIAYDYNPIPSQQALITPALNSVYGVDTPYGAGSPYGGDNVEAYRIFLQQQRCSAFQIQFRETNSSGEGLTLSGLLCIAGVKAIRRTQSAGRSVS